ncbi:MAG: PH domain-containing protein [Thermomicrobiales bacterium]
MTDFSSDEPIRQIPEPEQKLDPRAKRQWYLEELVFWGIVVPIVAAIAIGITLWRDSSWLWPSLVIGVFLLLAITSTFLSPNIRYRQWRYEIRESEVDLKHGILTQTRQLVPMSRIQHVDTRRGPLQRRFGLSSVILFTAAGAIEIPALSVEIAADVRDRIATLANVHEDL